MPQFTLSQTAQLGAVGGTPQSTTVTDNAMFSENISVPAAQPATLTTRTDNTTGTLTMTNGGHGITTGQRIDIQWAAGQTCNVTVGTVSGTSVPITLTTGTLPIATTAITVGIPQKVTLAIVGANCSAILFPGIIGAGSYFVTATSVPADVNAQYVAASSLYQWYTGSGITNPVTGSTLASIWVSHFSTTGAQTLQAGLLYH